MDLSLGFIVPHHVHLYCILSPFIAYIIGIFLILCKLLLYLLSITISYASTNIPNMDIHFMFYSSVLYNLTLI